MVRILSKLNQFCSENKIEYILTGTAALEIMGLPTTFKPRDIDIKLIAPTSDQINLLIQQQNLSGFDSKEYDGPGGCITFSVCDFKVNALIDYSFTTAQATTESQAIELIDKEKSRRFIIYAQKVKYALACKMKLNRVKDKEYLLDVLSCLASFIH